MPMTANSEAAPFGCSDELVHRAGRTLAGLNSVSLFFADETLNYVIDGEVKSADKVVVSIHPASLNVICQEQTPD